MGSEKPDVDVIVIGGGVNGTGVARDCALRGLSVALFEKNDLGFGASGNSSGMIHGGPRYLTKNPQVTYTSCLDSGHIQEVAPHLLFRVPFLVPVFGHGVKAELELSTYDGFFEVYDKYQHLKHGKKHLRFNAEETATLEPSLVPARGSVTFDEWGLDGVRLCVANLVDAVERGGKAFVHAEVTGIVRGEGGSARGVLYRDTQSQRTGKLTSRVVVNATGAWAPITAALLELPKTAARLRPGKGVHVFLDRRLSNFAVVTKAKDGRQVFLLPWQNMSVLGTTDDDFYGDLEDVVATTEEVRYLTEAIAQVLPAVAHARAIGTWGGVRPTLYEWGPHEDALSREHEIVDHRGDGIPDLFSMLGGKLASYRLFAEEMTDLLATRLGATSLCQTHVRALPGGEKRAGDEFVSALSEEHGLSLLCAKRLVYRHGARAERVLACTRDEPTKLREVCVCEPVTAAEVEFVVKNEWATSVEDISRRTRLGLGSCGGMRCALECGRILAETTGASPEQGRDSASAFLTRSLARRLPALGPEQARQEALALSHLHAEAGLVAAGGKRS